MAKQQTMTRRSFLRATSLASVGIALAACAPVPAGAPAAGSTAAAAPAAGKTQIRFHARIGSQEDALYDMQMPKFMEANPNIEVVKESFPGAEYNAKISTMLAGGTLGDVCWSALGGATIQFATSQGSVAPIDDLVASENVDLKQWYEGCLKGITVNGKLMGLPFKSHPGLAVVYYNQTAIEAAGKEVPKAGWTQEQQVELAKALTTADGKQFGYLPSEKGTQAITFLYDLFQTHKVAPKPDQMVGSDTDMWASGALGMYQGGTSISVFGKTIGDKFKWMVAPNPIGPGGVGGSDYEVDAQCVTTATKNPTEAFKWVQYLTSKDSGIQLGLIGGTVGGRPDVYGAPELLKFPFRVVFKEIMDNAQASRITANWRQSEAETALLQLTQPLWAGNEKPTPAFLDSVTSQIQDILDKPKP
ncbi:MAG: extracellular solute-binding protein [Chloroflexi bacterium]|nr:extracellular solute-binding protein [Chloroflexota bacterium]